MCVPPPPLCALFCSLSQLADAHSVGRAYLELSPTLAPPAPCAEGCLIPATCPWQLRGGISAQQPRGVSVTQQCWAIPGVVPALRPRAPTPPARSAGRPQCATLRLQARGDFGALAWFGGEGVRSGRRIDEQEGRGVGQGVFALVAVGAAALSPACV
jgi:hypothetical protein